jgi:hypothetical protein
MVDGFLKSPSLAVLPKMFVAIISLLLPPLTHAGSYPKYGSPDCPCIGIDVSGAKRPFSPIAVDDHVSGVIGQFPPELGTSCFAWDAGHANACSSDNALAFCKQQWCFVDPCNCQKSMSASTYLPTWKYHKKPLHFSYETCAPAVGPQAHASWFKYTPVGLHTTAKCSEIESGIGSPSCPCVGLSGRPGHITLMYGGKEGPYKAEIGSSCSLWENGAYPACTGKEGELPEWCFQTWCYVDPCNCKGIDEAPRPTQKIAGSNIRGRPMYFSFNTCGGNYLLGDGWVEKSCWTKRTPSDCKTHSNLLGQECGWLEGTGCIDGNLVPLCEAKVPILKDEL